MDGLLDGVQAADVLERRRLLLDRGRGRRRTVVRVGGEPHRPGVAERDPQLLLQPDVPLCAPPRRAASRQRAASCRRPAATAARPAATASCGPSAPARAAARSGPAPRPARPRRPASPPARAAASGCRATARPRRAVRPGGRSSVEPLDALEDRRRDPRPRAEHEPGDEDDSATLCRPTERSTISSSQSRSTSARRRSG